MPHSPSVRQRQSLGKGLSLVGVPATLDRAMLPKVNHDDAGSVSVPKSVSPRPAITSHEGLKLSLGVPSATLQPALHPCLGSRAPVFLYKTED